ncbi:hypothetical protein O0L34_g16243 [Tuta absoluta]|nr:hypothetical protein O0L34_g16243 [Tuta absoluta]
MRLLQSCVLLCSLSYCCCAYQSLSLGSKRKELASGREFSEVTRGELLKILATFEEDLNYRLQGKKLYPLFTAQFGNNKFSKPFIYPKVLHSVRGRTMTE